MPNRDLVRILCAVALGVLLAPNARGELAAWDQAKVIALAKDLATTADALYETFIQQPRPEPGSTQSTAYHGLENRVRLLRVEARVLVKSLEEGAGREQTVWLYDNLVSHGRSARYDARAVFVAEDVGKRAPLRPRLPVDSPSDGAPECSPHADVLAWTVEPQGCPPTAS